jgi:hypothetical protein
LWCAGRNVVELKIAADLVGNFRQNLLSQSSRRGLKKAKKCETTNNIRYKNDKNAFKNRLLNTIKSKQNLQSVFKASRNSADLNASIWQLIIFSHTKKSTRSRREL